MKLLKYFLVSFLLSSLLYAQADNAGTNENYNSAFSLDALSYKSKDTTASRVDIFVQIPYSNIQFLKNDNRYKAEYEINITIFDSTKDNTLWNEVWEEEVFADNYEQTLSYKNFNLSLKSTSLEPDNYVLRCIIEDLNSRKNASQEFQLHVKSFNDTLSLSSILLIKKIKETPQGDKIIPNIPHTVRALNEELPFYYEIYSREKRQVNVIYEIEDKSGEKDFSDTLQIELKKGTNKITEKLEYPSLTFGEYDLVISICDSMNTIMDKVGKPFYAKVKGTPRTVTDLDDAIDQMIYIADSDEIKKIKNADTYVEKLQKYIGFWASKDPSPDSPCNEVMSEYYRRINYAVKNFSIHKEDGWRTDMGMVYVTLGQPDNIERHPFNMSSKPYEVWSYTNIGRTFLFVDYTGFGDYRLVNNNSQDWNRYRY